MSISANINFLIGSLICAFSSIASLLISGRAIHGVGSGGIVVLVFKTLKSRSVEWFNEESELNLVLGKH